MYCGVYKWEVTADKCYNIHSHGSTKTRIFTYLVVVVCTAGFTAGGQIGLPEVITLAGRAVSVLTQSLVVGWGKIKPFYFILLFVPPHAGWPRG